MEGADIEIVSPNFMNTRPIADGKQFIPDPSQSASAVRRTQAEDVAFDKAEEAASVEEIRKNIELVEARLQALEKDETPDTEAERSRLAARKVRLSERLKAAEDERKAAELAEQTGSQD